MSDASEGARFEELKKLYSFSESALRNQFLAVCHQINLDNMVLTHLHNLVLFRELFFGQVQYPEELFSYDTAVISALDNHHLRRMVEWAPDRVQYDLTTEITAIYPNVPWIVPYFVVSSFPAIFGHFTSEEYLLAGQQFIESHIQDKLAPQLIGTYLLHCFLFRDRLLEGFFLRVARSEQEVKLDELPSILFEAFAACASYFSGSHCHVVTLLRKEKEQLAITAVLDCFLYEVVRLWHFSPLFQQIDFHVNGIHAPDEFLILDRLKTAVANRDFALQFLDCFFPSVLTRIPQIGSIQFYGGVKFSLSVVDAALMRHFVALATPGKAPERRPAEVATAITDAFKLRTRYTHFPSSAVLAPTPVESASSGLTLKKLEEHKAFHDFLFTCAGGLRHFHTVVAALKSTVTLRYRSLGRRLFLADAACNPAEYIERQHRLYVASLAQIFVRNTLRDFIVTRGCADFDSGFLAQIFLRINAAMQQETNPADAILVATTDYINEWKARMNAEFPGSQAASLPSRDVDYPFCQYFVDGVASTGLGLLMDRLSAMDINIVPDVTLPPEGQTLLEHRASLLDSFVRANTVSNLCAGLGNDGWEAPPVKRAIESAKALQFLLCSAERAFREHFVQLKEKKGTGDALLLFLQAEKWLRPRMECDPFKTDSEGRRLLLASLMERVEPLYIRANLLRGLIVLRSIRDNRMPGLERLNAAGNPITDEVNTAFENLRNWFGINPSITYP